MSKRRIPPGASREWEDHQQIEAKDYESLIRQSFEKILPLVVKEVERQQSTADYKEFTAFADITINPVSRIVVEIRGELRVPGEIMVLLVGE